MTTDQDFTEDEPAPGQLYQGEDFLADVLCQISRKAGRLAGEITIVTGGAGLKPGDDLVIRLPDGRQAFCRASRALASGRWIVDISRIEE
jgi:hypothetical protein